MAVLNPPKTSALGVVVVLALVAFGVFVLWWCQHVPGVTVDMDPLPTHLGPASTLELDAQASRGGIAWVEVRLVQADTEAVVTRWDFPADPQNQRHLEAEVDVAKLGLAEGPATLQVYAQDGFWRPLGTGDTPVLSVPVTLDFTPPGLQVLAVTRYPAQGGAGIAVLESGDADTLEVRVGDARFRAFPAGPSQPHRSVAMFALAWDQSPSDPMLAVATDAAGNRTTRELPVVVKQVRYERGSVDLAEDFLRRKIHELLPDRATDTPEEVADAFVVLNRDLRREAAETKRRLSKNTSPHMLWRGPFLQPRNTKVFSNFAETRDYRYAGRTLDTEVHLGFDLASVKQAPVPAANTGIVVHAGPLSIYGNAVVLDHGLGLQTLYAHLSSLDVAVGDTVQQGQELGHTGTTGLAVGDHLHFEVLVEGVPVTPIQWWDAAWVRDHIGGPLHDAGLELPE
jgi:murein DD-endopeptidase MepM/ murein hydrolase activator NlpD